MTRGGHLRRNETSVHEFRTLAPDAHSEGPTVDVSAAPDVFGSRVPLPGSDIESQFAYKQASPHRSNGGDT